MDRAVLRMTGGNATVTSWLTGIPPLWLTTIGARSGHVRTLPLFGIPIADDLALLGTSFGQEATPSWVYNLEANPTATVSYRGVRIDALARPALTDEESFIWGRAASVYPGYAKYALWAPHRQIRVFVLEGT